MFFLTNWLFSAAKREKLPILLFPNSASYFSSFFLAMDHLHPATFAPYHSLMFSSTPFNSMLYSILLVVKSLFHSEIPNPNLFLFCFLSVAAAAYFLNLSSSLPSTYFSCWSSYSSQQQTFWTSSYTDPLQPNLISRITPKLYKIF